MKPTFWIWTVDDQGKRIAPYGEEYSNRDDAQAQADRYNKEQYEDNPDFCARVFDAEDTEGLG